MPLRRLIIFGFLQFFFQFFYLTQVIRHEKQRTKLFFKPFFYRPAMPLSSRTKYFLGIIEKFSLRSWSTGCDLVVLPDCCRSPQGAGPPWPLDMALDRSPP